MKKAILILLIGVSVNPVHAQKDTVWRKGGLVALNFSQVSLTNWAAGGQNSITGNAIVNYYANYKSGKKSWNNNIDLGYGLAIMGKHGSMIKSDDRVDISSKYGRQA